MLFQLPSLTMDAVKYQLGDLIEKRLSAYEGSGKKMHARINIRMQLSEKSGDEEYAFDQQVEVLCILDCSRTIEDQNRILELMRRLVKLVHPKPGVGLVHISQDDREFLLKMHKLQPIGGFKLDAGDSFTFEDVRLVSDLTS
jgi:hypothetical protein